MPCKRAVLGPQREACIRPHHDGRARRPNQTRHRRIGGGNGATVDAHRMGPVLFGEHNRPFYGEAIPKSSPSSLMAKLTMMGMPQAASTAPASAG